MNGSSAGVFTHERAFVGDSEIVGGARQGFERAVEYVTKYGGPCHRVWPQRMARPKPLCAGTWHAGWDLREEAKASKRVAVSSTLGWLPLSARPKQLFTSRTLPDARVEVMELKLPVVQHLSVIIVRCSCVEVRLGKASLAFEKELAKRVHRHAQTHRAACLLVRGFGDTAVRVAPGVVQSHRLPHSRNAGMAGLSFNTHHGLRE